MDFPENHCFKMIKQSVLAVLTATGNFSEALISIRTRKQHCRGKEVYLSLLAIRSSTVHSPAWSTRLVQFVVLFISMKKRLFFFPVFFSLFFLGGGGGGGAGRGGVESNTLPCL